MDISRLDQKKRKRTSVRESFGLVWRRFLPLLFLLVRFEEAPHHRQYVTLKRGSRTIQALVALPNSKNKVLVVILVHEIYGLSDWAKGMADELADQGFIVVPPTC
jgi:hypothetical protein